MFPKLLDFGGFFLPTYGVLVAAGFLAALWLTGRLAKRSGLDPEKVTNSGVYAALAGLAGAKLLMFALDFDYYRKNPGEMFSLATLQAGGVFFGGLIFALAMAFYWIRKQKLPLAATMDSFGPGLALGQAIGRLGCFAAGCCWGASCNRSWAVEFTNPEAHRLTGVPILEPLHPTQLYEAFLLAAVFATLYWRFGKPHKPGAIIGLYLVLASAQRFGVEFFRAHQQANYLNPLSNAQWISLGLAALGASLLVRGGRTANVG